MIKWDPLRENALLIFVLNVMYCIMYEHSLMDKFWEWKCWGSPRVTLGQPKSFAFLYKYRRVSCRIGLFPIEICESDVRRTISFCIKKLQVSCWRKLCGTFQMLCHGFAECELFHFQFCVHEL